MILKPTHRPAFTLIELLVVISIIALLAGIAFPAFQSAIKQARLVEAAQNARSIGLALRAYAQDNEGAYPGVRDPEGNEARSSNEVFRQLIPNQLDGEKVFALAQSKVAPRSDGNISSPAAVLAPGENHWAYVAGLSTSSKSSWPLIVDHTDGTGYYTTDETVPGGTWAGTHAIVVCADTSARAEKLLTPGEKGSKRYLPRLDDRTKNALHVNDYMGEGAKLLEPLR